MPLRRFGEGRRLSRRHVEPSNSDGLRYAELNNMPLVVMRAHTNCCLRALKELRRAEEAERERQKLHVPLCPFNVRCFCCLQSAFVDLLGFLGLLGFLAVHCFALCFCGSFFTCLVCFFCLPFLICGFVSLAVW